MSSAKNKKTESSPLTMRPSERKEPKYRFELSQKNLEQLQCFIRKRSVRGDNKRISRIKSTASVFGRPEIEKPALTGQRESTEHEETRPAEERNRRASERCA